MIYTWFRILILYMTSLYLPFSSFLKNSRYYVFFILCLELYHIVPIDKELHPFISNIIVITLSQG